MTLWESKTTETIKRTVVVKGRGGGEMKSRGTEVLGEGP